MKRADFIIILILVAVLLTGLLVYKTMQGEGKSVIVTVNGDNYGVYSLDDDITVNIKGTNTLVIKNRTADITEANCPDKICVKHKPISKSGDEIICLPNRVIVRISGKSLIDGEVG
ncbi:MAG: NusG domain II-containing protein [Bacillota bacterium]|nr:NusG domain II-containing protein [Bacillota bacterium]